jgi:hypothetical protein
MSASPKHWRNLSTLHLDSRLPICLKFQATAFVWIRPQFPVIQSVVWRRDLPSLNGRAGFRTPGFHRTVSGDAYLCVNPEGAVKLSNILIEGPSQSQQLDSSGAEILTEIGNMLLSACLGVFGNLLQLQFSFSVPNCIRNGSSNSGFTLDRG